MRTEGGLSVEPAVPLFIPGRAHPATGSLAVNMRYKILRSIVGGLVAGLLLLPLINLVLSVRPPTFVTDDDPSRHGLAFEIAAFRTADGLTLRGWFIPSSRSGAPGGTRRQATIVVGHGYPADKGNVLGQALFLHGCFNLLLYDSRYFGESQGVYTTAGFLEARDLDAAMAYLKARPDVDPAKLGAMGFSMSAAAFLLANQRDLKALVADSSYATLEGVIRQQFIRFPEFAEWALVTLTKLYASLLLGVDVDVVAPERAVASLRTPLLLIHGAGDNQIPVEHAYRIYANAHPTTAELWIVPGADHVVAYSHARQAYEDKVSRFFVRHLLASSPVCDRDQPH
jgi:fermentation-respiration switch protein FrsA (DUF1100 family)